MLFSRQRTWCQIGKTKGNLMCLVFLFSLSLQSVCTNVWGCACTYVRTWRTKVNGQCLPQSFSTLYVFQHDLELTDQQALGSSCPCLVSVLGSFYIFKVIFLNTYLCMYLCVCHICDTLGAPKMSPRYGYQELNVCLLQQQKILLTHLSSPQACVLC